MSGNRPPPDKKVSKKQKAAAMELTPGQFEEEFKGVLLHLKQNRELSKSLYIELNQLMSFKLDQFYRSIEKMTYTAKAGLEADIVTAAKIKSPVVLSKISGSVNGLLSDIISVNKEQKQLFEDMVAAKLTGAVTGGAKVPFDTVKASLFAVKVDHLIKNLQNLRQKLDRNLRMTHGKGLTLEHGKDLPKDHREQLVQECKRLEMVISQQIKQNLALKHTLTSLANRSDVPTETPRQNKMK